MWGTGTLELRWGRAEPCSQGSGKAGPTWHCSSLWPLSGMGPPAHLGIAGTRQQGLRAKPVVTRLTTTQLQAIVSSSQCPREGWSQSLRPLVGEGKAGQVRPLGPALALLSGGPALRSQDKGQTVEVVSLYKEAAGTSRDLGGLLGQHGLLHGLLQRLPRHQQAHHLL